MKKQFKNRFLIISLLFLANVTVALSQQLISGTVVDKNGETLIGVSVLVKGTTVGTVSDVNGKFSIKVKGASDVLQFSYVGYINQTVTVGNQKTLKIVRIVSSRLSRDKHKTLLPPGEDLLSRSYSETHSTQK